MLRQEREQRDFSRYELARRSGVSESMLSLVERGLRNPSVKLLGRIAKGIGIDLADILKRAQESVSKSKKESSMTN
jgi:transcriptional regulator with XRE-family HTH domain